MKNEIKRENVRKTKIGYFSKNEKLENKLEEFEKLFDNELNGYKKIINKSRQPKNELMYLKEINLIHNKLIDLIEFEKICCRGVMSNMLNNNFNKKEFSPYIHDLCDNLFLFLTEKMEKPAKRISKIINEFIGVVDSSNQL